MNPNTLLACLVTFVCGSFLTAAERHEIIHHHTDLFVGWDAETESLLLGWRITDFEFNGGAPVFIAAADAYARIRENQFVPAPAGWGFTGAAAGEPLWWGPADSYFDHLYLGFAASFPGVSGFSGPVTFTLESVAGPGHVTLVAGEIPVWASSVGGSSDAFNVSVGGHNHFDWLFSAQGVHTLTITASVVKDGQLRSVTENFDFHVGAIPEPATAVALAGLLALGFVGARRSPRRRRAAP